MTTTRKRPTRRAIKKPGPSPYVEVKPPVVTPDSVGGQRLRETQERRARIMLEQNGDKAFALCTSADVVVLMALRLLRSGASVATVALRLTEYQSAADARNGVTGDAG